VSLENEVQGWESIHTVNADGTSTQKAVTAIMGLENSASAWTPDGKFLVYMDDRHWTGGPPGGQVYAQSVGEGTNTKLTDIRDVIFLSIAEARGCGRYFQYP
jgi:Tol biopolymer transport system component